jgi:hypothetical protein
VIIPADRAVGALLPLSAPIVSGTRAASEAFARVACARTAGGVTTPSAVLPGTSCGSATIIPPEPTTIITPGTGPVIPPEPTTITASRTGPVIPPEPTTVLPTGALSIATRGAAVAALGESAPAELVTARCRRASVVAAAIAAAISAADGAATLRRARAGPLIGPIRARTAAVSRAEAVRA